VRHGFNFHPTTLQASNLFSIAVNQIYSKKRILMETKAVSQYPIMAVPGDAAASPWMNASAFRIFLKCFPTFFIAEDLFDSFSGFFLDFSPSDKTL